MTSLRTTTTAFAVSFLVGAATAQGQDPSLIMKWSMAEIVHYDVVAEYSLNTAVLTGGSQGVRRANSTAVTDRFELSFDWSPMTRALVGEVTFKNAPSTVATTFAGACQPPRVDGKYEHLEVLAATPAMGELTLSVKRAFPAGAIPFLNEEQKCGLDPVTAKTQTIDHIIPVIPGKFLVLPEAAPKHIRIGESESENNTLTIGKDGKTIVVDDTKDGWTYTYSIRIAK